MGTVAITFRVLPEGTETDLDALKENVRSALGPAFRSLEEIPVAFGLKAIMTVALIDDEAGGSERLEQDLSNLPGVGSVETVDVTLV